MIAAVRLRGRRLRISLRLVAALLALALLLAGGYLWLRDSSLVAVRRVTILGVSGPDAARIRSALQSAALSMTTLDVQPDALNTAVAPFPVVKTLRAEVHFPHAMTITVTEQIPVAAIVVGNRSLAVAADGTLLHDVSPSTTLASIPLSVPPVGARLSDPNALAALAVLGAGPWELVTHVAQVSRVSPYGVVVQLRDGPALYFGGTDRLADKWTAATKVLADPGSKGASYIDVSDPERPAPGGSNAGASGTADTSGTTTNSATTPQSSGVGG